jgi:hypothetical protein
MSNFTDSILGVDAATAHYWNGPISRKEAQQVFDEFKAVFDDFVKRLFNMELTLACLSEKVGLTDEDIKAFGKRKAEEFAKLQAEAQKQGQPAPEPKKPASSIILL